jgi:hypothetical protein
LFSKEDFNFFILKKALASRRSHSHFLFLLNDELEVKELDKIRQFLEDHDSKKNVHLNIITENKNYPNLVIYSNKKNDHIPSLISQKNSNDSKSIKIERTFPVNKTKHQCFQEKKNFCPTQSRIKKTYKIRLPQTRIKEKTALLFKEKPSAFHKTSKSDSLTKSLNSIKKSYISNLIDKKKSYFLFGKAKNSRTQR